VCDSSISSNTPRKGGFCGAPIDFPVASLQDNDEIDGGWFFSLRPLRCSSCTLYSGSSRPSFPAHDPSTETLLYCDGHPVKTDKLLSAPDLYWVLVISPSSRPGWKRTSPPPFRAFIFLHKFLLPTPFCACRSQSEAGAV